MLTQHGGNPTPSQIVTTVVQGIKTTRVFQSYGVVIAKIVTDYSNPLLNRPRRKVYVDKIYGDYSNTTRRYRNVFLGMNSQELRDGIKSGAVKVVNLND